jgi:hypothetical protein
MLAEAVALDPRSMFIPHMVLVFMKALEDVYFGVSGWGSGYGEPKP